MVMLLVLVLVMDCSSPGCTSRECRVPSTVRAKPASDGLATHRI